MHLLRSPFIKALCLVALISMLSGLAVSAAPTRADITGSLTPYVGCKPASQSPDRAGKPVAQPSVDCCVGKISPTSSGDKTISTRYEPVDPCCFLVKIKLAGTGKLSIPTPCVEPEPPDTTCGIAYSDGAVVGDLPFDSQAYWAPGKPALKVTLNAGTYWVFGVAADENGDEYYEILVACQMLFVPVGSMQPSYKAPWNGEPLPTLPVK